MAFSDMELKYLERKQMEVCTEENKTDPKL